MIRKQMVSEGVMDGQEQITGVVVLARVKASTGGAYMFAMANLPLKDEEIEKYKGKKIKVVTTVEIEE